MKKIFFPVFVLMATASLTLCGCKKWVNEALDIEPSDRYTVSAVWSSETSADTYLLGLYSILKENNGGVGGDGNLVYFWDAYSDIMKSNSWNQYNHPYNVTFLQGPSSFSGQSAGTFECWSDSYTRIRRCNEFLRDAPIYGPNISDTYAQTRMGEARFVRAFIYWRLMAIYGKCILRDAVDGPDQNNKGLATPDQIWDLVEADLRFAGENIATGLPEGRITRAAAWALLSRTMLYAGRWDVAIEAADKCKECGGQLDPNYAHVFEDSASPENLMVFKFQQNKLTHRADVFFRPLGDGAQDGLHPGANIYAVFGPTSELVDSYEMADGTPFSWSTHGDDPYTGREPRFYASILYNGAPWEGRTIETFDGGADKIVEFNISGSAGSTVTGYYLKKFITEGQTGWEKFGSDHFATLIRYAEVLLNKAEAYAMSGDLTNANITLNEVRSRVGLPGRGGTTLEEVMADIKHERMVELAGEGLRFWDLRRWKDAVDVINEKNFHGCWITKNDDGTFTYKQVSCDGAGKTHTFLESYYAFAIPIGEISNNESITAADQNPGW